MTSRESNDWRSKVDDRTQPENFIHALRRDRNSSGLHPPPVPAPSYMSLILEALRRSVSRGRPYGSEVWVQDIVQRLGLQATIRPRGRPRKRPPAVPDGDDN